MATTSTGGYPGGQLDQEDSFRIIEIQPGEHDSAVTVRLVTTNLQDGPSYEALSYAWGDLAETEPIQVVAAGFNGSGDSPSAPFSVTTNCADALRRLRSRTAPRTLWVDSICINQALVPERNQQLRLMSRIYSSASRVVVYLGENSGDGGSEAVMDWLREIYEPSDSASGHPPAPDLHVIRDFLSRRWFTRVWVLQEICLAREATVVCGDREVNWNAFKELRDWDRNQLGSKGPRRFCNIPYAVQSLVSNDSDWIKGSLPSEQYYLLRLLADTRDLGATDAKDKLFAILPLLAWERKRQRETNPDADASGYYQSDFMIPECDYGRSPSEIFEDLARDLINAVGPHVLYCVTSPMSVLELPSWAPDWTACNPPTFSGESEHRGSWLIYLSSKYNINKDIPKTWYFSEYSTLDGKHGTQLHVNTTMERIATVGDMCDVYNEYFPVEQWESLCQPDHLNSRHGPRKPGLFMSRFIYVLFKGEFGYEHVAAGHVAMIKEYNLAKSEDRSFKPIARLRAGRTKYTKQTTLVDVFQALPSSWRIQSDNIFQACHRQKFFVTDAGYLGLAPEAARVGDHVMTIQGLNDPFLVSLVGIDDDGPEAVRLLGTCYREPRGRAKEGDSSSYKERVIR